MQWPATFQKLWKELTTSKDLLHNLFLKYEVNMFGYNLNKLKEI